MCTGLEIAAMIAGPAMSAAGAMMQQNEMEENQARMAEARNEKLRTTLAKNDAIAEQSRDTFNQRKQQMQADESAKAEQQAKDKRQDTLETAVEETPTSPADVPISGSAPTVVRSELAKRMSEAMSGAKGQAQRLGTLGGYGDAWLNQGFQDAAAGRDIAQQANFASGNMSILPYQQDIAETRAYKPISPIGGLLQGFGSMVGSYGGGGGMPKKSYTSPWMG